MRTKRLLLAIVMMLGIASQTVGQMVLKMPKWDKFVRINSDGINLRKAPNANSSKLLSLEFGQFQEFSWVPKKEFEAFHFMKGDILPVLKENAEWYCLYFGNANFVELNGAGEVYIMKKFCSEVTSASFGAHDVEKTEGEIVKGPTGYIVGVYFLGSPSRAPFCRIGHKAGKYIVMADYDGAMEFAQKFITQGMSYMEQEFHVNKVSETDVESFVSSVQAPSIFDVWVKFTGEEWPRCYFFNTSKYKYPIETFTVTSTHVATNTQNNETVYDQADQMPSFPGGAGAMMTWLSQNIHYPAVALNNRVQGHPIVSFVVEKDGSISNVKIARSVDPALDREAVRVVSSMPNWNPGMKNGMPVRVKYTVPIMFRL